RRLPLNGRQRLQFNGSLTIDPLDKSSDAGLYSCEARGQNGLSARQSLQLNILGMNNQRLNYNQPSFE
ncbi:Down Syndrome cell adhesion molecule protein 1, partial [Daphnia magna]